MLTVIIGAIALVLIVIVLLMTVGLAAAAIGGIFVAISVAVIKVFIIPKFEARERYRLASDNLRITPEKLEVRFDSYKGGYVIDCYYTAPDTGKKFVFTSEPMPNDPSAYLNSANITVVTNRIDYSNYYVDMDGKDRI
ncbi:MAG: hypothetical protein J6I46_14715 [Ruminococcus sp.]|jgi:hypothetical protein|nr:hypothetical protein [Ruminococcus sp.]MBQ1433701.1 hypothetical protein [Ruminococcus sp.]